MKRLMRWTVVLILLLSGAVSAQTQNLVGQWQGTLAIQGKELRLVFVIAASGHGNTFTATMNSIDPGGGGTSANVAAQAGTIRLAAAPAGITCEGKLGGDGNSIAGTFTQGQGSIPLTLARATKDSAW